MSDRSESMMMRLMMAAVRKAGGEMTVTMDEFNMGGSFSVEFDPPASDNGPPTERIHLKVSESEDDFEEDEADDE